MSSGPSAARFLGKGIAILALAAASLAQASVVSFSAGYQSVSTQNSDAEPTPAYWYHYANLFTDGDNEAVGGTYGSPGGGSYDFFFSPNTLLVYYSPTFPAQADLELAYPAGDYTFDITAGPLAPASATLPVPATDFANEVPYLTGGSYSALQATSPGAALAVTWPEATHNGPSPNAFTTFTIINYVTTNTDLSEAVPSAGSVGTTIPGTVFRSGHTYGFDLTFSTDTPFPAQGFGGATGATVSARQTGGLFRVPALPGTVSGQVTLEAYYYPTYFPVTAEILDTDGTVLDTQTFPLGYVGYYAFDTAVTGVHDIRFRADKFLNTVVQDVDLSVGQDATNAYMRNGDCDGSNRVDLDDFLILAATYEVSPSSSGYDPRGELNGDGQVNLDDFLILAGNYEVDGD